LMTRGQQIIEKLLPGIGEALLRAGAELVDAGQDIAWRNPAGWGVRFHASLPILSASRPLIDHLLRRRILEILNVHFIQNASVQRLLHRNGRITGIGAHSSTQACSPVEIEADLVVDASGRSSSLPAWLHAIGYDGLEESAIDAHVGYAS